MKHEARFIARAGSILSCFVFVACAEPSGGNTGTGGSTGGTVGPIDPASDGVPYNSLPWKLGLLTKTN